MAQPIEGGRSTLNVESAALGFKSLIEPRVERGNLGPAFLTFPECLHVLAVVIASDSRSPTAQLLRLLLLWQLSTWLPALQPQTGAISSVSVAVNLPVSGFPRLLSADQGSGIVLPLIG